MKKKEKELPDGETYCKLRINDKTVILIRNKASYDLWLQKFPNAKIVK